MTQTTYEIQDVITTLALLLHRHTTSDSTTHRPYGTDWVIFTHAMHRLLVLHGLISPGDRLPLDPWELYLAEYAPRRAVREEEREVEREGGPVARVAYFPVSILRTEGRVNGTANGSGHRVRFEDEDAEREAEGEGEERERGRERVRGEMGSSRRRIPRGVS